MKKIFPKLTVGGMILLVFSFFLMRLFPSACVLVDPNSPSSFWITWCHVLFVISVIAAPVFVMGILLRLVGKSFTDVPTLITFSKYFFPIYYLIILMTPWRFGDEYFSIGKTLIAILLSAVYFVVALLLYAYQTIKK